jgi:hypothetical protein
MLITISGLVIPDSPLDPNLSLTNVEPMANEFSVPVVEGIYRAPFPFLNDPILTSSLSNPIASQPVSSTSLMHSSPPTNARYSETRTSLSIPPQATSEPGIRTMDYDTIREQKDELQDRFETMVTKISIISRKLGRKMEKIWNPIYTTTRDTLLQECLDLNRNLRQLLGQQVLE